MSDLSALSYRRHGNTDRPVTLYLHGFLGCKEDWDEIITLRTDVCAHLSVDLPGHGSSQKLPDRRFEMSGCAGLLLELLDSEKIDRCHLIGYSMGGRLALYLAVRYPERFTGVVIESASPGLKTDDERSQRRHHDDQVAQKLLPVDFDSFLDEWYRQPIFAGLDRQSDAFRAMIERRRHGHPSGLARSLRFMGTGAQPSLWDDLSATSSRLFFVAGANDAKFRRLAGEMHHLCPRSQTAIIANAGHNTHLDRPDEFCRQIERFLAEEQEKPL